VPNPANGTPLSNHRKANGIIAIREIAEKNIPKIDINLSGLYELAKIPFRARSIVFKVGAFDLPPNRGGLIIGIPIDLKPTHANNPRTNRFLSDMVLTTS
jgi:hypothetical protein